MNINAKDFNADILKDFNIIKKNNKKKNSKSYIDVVTAFDIEASVLPNTEQAIMYIWQFQIGQNITIIGRYWEEFNEVILKIRDFLDNGVWLCCYTHNLSYEFQFLRGIYAFEPEEVFCTEPRKVLKCSMYDCIEFRCSYYLTNMSLDKLLKKFNVENKKLTYDYKKVRYPWTHLSDEEIAYCINDVKGLVQALYKQLASDKDNIATVPLTATGYVRRDVRKAMYKFNYKQLKEMLPRIKVYKALREAFRGGDTLSNRWQTDEIIEDIGSADIVSSYPASMLICKFPMSPFVLEDPADFNKLYKNKKRCLLFKVIFIGLKLNSSYQGHAYLSRDKCRDIEEGVYANGRILSADYLETTLTDIDFNIISRRYKWMEMQVFKLWSAKYDYLPEAFRDVIRQYYKVKTELKGVEEGTDEYYYYMKNKEKLNSCYGMCVEDPAKDSIIFEDNEYKAENKSLSDLIAKHNKHAFLNYAWGVWVAAWSRKRLADGIDVVTKHDEEPFNFIYSDTDSIKYIGEVDFSEYNKQVEKEAIENGAYASDRDGVVHYMGVYEDEGYSKPNRFKTLGAKKYVLEDKDKKLHITIAGVNKKLGGEELGVLENFKEGFIFDKAGGTESIFNDNIDAIYFTLDKHKIRITDNIVIKDSTYTLGLTAEYRAILDGVIDIKYSDHDIAGIYKVKC